MHAGQEVPSGPDNGAVTNEMDLSDERLFPAGSANNPGLSSCLVSYHHQSALRNISDCLSHYLSHILFIPF
ncbi:unnamed protein product [Nezara viridula]|uniref:Uncharacterized protein n=1 Tax=Nezara viridula TaxID=85310 RepID=A0A9P0HIR7_NEZVI|nr:unnamed protein product [Nezara viridula]